MAGHWHGSALSPQRHPCYTWYSQKYVKQPFSIQGDQLFNFLCSQIEGAEDISYFIDTSYKSPTPSAMNWAIQLGTPFYITITGRAKLGGFWNFNLVNITIVARGSGVSEHYWK